MPCLKTIINCFALEHSASKTKYLKMSKEIALDSIFLQIILLIDQKNFGNKIPFLKILPAHQVHFSRFTVVKKDKR